MAVPEVAPEQEAEEELEKGSWKFVYEALTHVHSLRLFLFNPDIEFSLRCIALKAYMLPSSPFSASPVIVCEWESGEGDSCTVYTPMPFCLIDHSAPFSAVAHSDHIEIKLKLLSFGGTFLDGLSFLGFSHNGQPIKDGEKNSEPRNWAETPFSLNSDAQALSAISYLTFYCRNCSTRLTKPIRRVLDLPSTDWRELSEHWFGTCCCAAGSQTKSLVTEFQRQITPKAGICISGSTICAFHPDSMDFDMKFGQKNLMQGVGVKETKILGQDGGQMSIGHTIHMQGTLRDKELEADNCTSGLSSKGSKLVMHTTGQVEKGNGVGSDLSGKAIEVGACAKESADITDSKGRAMNENSADLSAHLSQVTIDDANGEQELDQSQLSNQERISTMKVLTDIEGESAGKGKGSDGKTSVKNTKVVVDPAGGNPCSLVQEEASNGRHLHVHKPSENVTSIKTLEIGFMAGSSASSSTLTWMPFRCYGCSSIVGACSGGEDEGIQLFKCHISTETRGGAADVFRYHTLERVFCCELLANAEGNSSYRYIIRDLNSKVPLLQLVLVNDESWNSAGNCLGAKTSLSEQRVRPFFQRKEDYLNITGKREISEDRPSSTFSKNECTSKEETLPAFLNPVVKVMFCDCSNFKPGDLSLVEEWGDKQQADDIFMLKHEVKSLTECLYAHKRLFPESCASLQQFNLSFLAK